MIVEIRRMGHMIKATRRIRIQISSHLYSQPRKTTLPNDFRNNSHHSSNSHLLFVQPEHLTPHLFPNVATCVLPELGSSAGGYNIISTVCGLPSNQVYSLIFAAVWWVIILIQVINFSSQLPVQFVSDGSALFEIF